MAEFISGYIKTELLILIPILWICGQGLKKTSLNAGLIPILLGAGGVLLASLYVFSTCECYCFRGVLYCIFAGITQGLLCAGASVYANEIIKMLKEKKSGAISQPTQEERSAESNQSTPPDQE